MSNADKFEPPLLSKKEDVEKIFDPTNKLLTVVDIFDPKFGNCKIMNLTLQIINDSEDHLDKQVKFWRVNKNTLEQFSDVDATSQAIFRFYKKGEIVHQMVGANAFEFKQTIKQFRPTDNELEED